MSNKKNKSFYITTTLPYVNSKPHVGFAMEIVRADTVARYKRAEGFDVFFNTGTDEHGLKIFQKARELGKDVQQFVDENAQNFRDLMRRLNISADRFIRTSDKNHKAAAQKFWQICDRAGYIYKKNYKGLYCVGCEMFVTEKDLVNGCCPHHLNQKPQEIEEENYFFKYGEFAQQLLDLYKDKNDFVYPASRLNEVRKFVEAGLEDFSISRVREKMPHGVAVPGDDTQVMYVWFDALVNYISTLGWPDDVENFEKFWRDGTPVQYCGKDNLHQQAARWQAMLFAAGLPPSRHIVIDGFITSGGQKMSKSLGNVVDPFEYIEEFGADALRYYLLREIHPFEDSDFTHERFVEAYNANLANGIGNLTNRVMKMSQDNLPEGQNVADLEKEVFIDDSYRECFETFDLKKAADLIWKKIQEVDQQIQTDRPFEVTKTDPARAAEMISSYVTSLWAISVMLAPLLPDTSEKIQQAIRANKKPEDPLFGRK